MLNKVILMGRLTRDPELKSTTGGTNVCSFTLAVQRRYAPKGQERQTDFINCTAWRNTAEFISKYFTKGQMMVVEGSIQTRSWDDQNGQKRYATDVVVDNVEFGESKRDNQSAGMSSGYTADPDPMVGLPDIAPIDADDDLPF